MIESDSIKYKTLPKSKGVCQQTLDNNFRKAKRQNIPERLRFKIYRRDGFTCQYCGRTAREMELSIDHIIPISKGGTNDASNLTTACMPCNRGKSDENPPYSELKPYAERTVFINNPFPQHKTTSYRGIMDYLGATGNIIQRIILIFKPGEHSIPREAISPPIEGYRSVKIHNEQIKFATSPNREAQV